MENKKNPKYDLERKSPLFFAFGLMVALLCVTVAFEWKSEYDPMELPSSEDHFPPPIEIPITSFPKPEPPKPKEKIEEIVKPEQIKDIIETTKALKQMVDTKEPLDIPIDDILLDEPPVEKPPVVHDIVENMPEFPGGEKAFLKYVAENIEYPSMERRMGISGKVFVQFIIDVDGELIDVQVMKGVSKGLDEEALRVIKESPRWTPGKQRGRPVKVRMVLPITFSLNY